MSLEVLHRPAARSAHQTQDIKRGLQEPWLQWSQNCEKIVVACRPSQALLKLYAERCETVTREDAEIVDHRHRIHQRNGPIVVNHQRIKLMSVCFFLFGMPHRKHVQNNREAHHKQTKTAYRLLEETREETG